MIELNITLLIQLGNFLVTLVVLNWLLVRPVREIIRRRKENLQGLEDNVATLVAQADAELLNYEQTLATAREAAAKLRHEARSETAEVERALIDASSRKAQSSLKEARSAIEQASAQARSALHAELPALVDKATARILA